MVDAVGTVTKIVEVALKIKNAADKVKQNEDICKQIKSRVEILSNTMLQYQNNTELMNSLEVRSALEALDQILGEALKLVTTCQETKIVRLLYNSRHLSHQLIQVEQCISNKNMDAMLAIMSFLLPKPFSFHPPPSQLKGMAETLPGGVAENGISGEQEQTSDGPNGLLVSDGSSSIRNKTSHPKITNNGIIPPDAESHHKAEWSKMNQVSITHCLAWRGPTVSSEFSSAGRGSLRDIQNNGDTSSTIFT